MSRKRTARDSLGRGVLSLIRMSEIASGKTAEENTLVDRVARRGNAGRSGGGGLVAKGTLRGMTDEEMQVTKGEEIEMMLSELDAVARQIKGSRSCGDYVGVEWQIACEELVELKARGRRLRAGLRRRGHYGGLCQSDLRNRSQS